MLPTTSKPTTPRCSAFRTVSATHRWRLHPRTGINTSTPLGPRPPKPTWDSWPQAPARRRISGVAIARALALLTLALAAAATAPPRAVPFVEPASDPAAARTLVQAMQAPRKVSYMGRLSTIAWGSSGTQAVEIEIDHRAPNATRKWYIAPSSVYGNYVIEHGTTSYVYDLRAQSVTISHYPSADEDDLTEDANFGLLTTNYRAVPGADDEIAGRKAHTLSLINRYSGVRLQRIWIDAQTSLLLAKERYHANGSVAYTSRYQEITYRDVPQALFSTATPEGFTVKQGRDFGTPSHDLERVLSQADFSATGPRYLPEGFALVSGDVTTIRGVRSLHLLYTDGLRSLSLFENVARNGGANFSGMQTHEARVGGHDATYVEDEPNLLLAWREQSLNFTLVGDLPLRELERIATSVAP
ncbi:DUF4367 domain-containing protein [bacterium]|nr:MAG: DUF4367 domain-containing protein [bacterium]